MIQQRMKDILILLMLVTPLPTLGQTLSTARIELNGVVPAGTCTVAPVMRKIGGARSNLLPEGEGRSGGVIASHTSFDIALTACSGVAGATFQIGSAADASAEQSDIFRNKAPDGAAFTGYWIKEGPGRCAGGVTVAPGALISRAFTTSTYRLPLCAQYYKTAGGLAGTGPLSTSFTVTVTYQ